MSQFRILLAAGTVAAWCSLAQSGFSADLKIPWLEGAGLGMGYDAATGTLMRENCAPVTPLEPTSINVSKLDYRRADSKEELISKMSASAEGEARFSLYSGSARASFAKQLEFRRNDTTMLVQIEVATDEVGSKRNGTVDIGGDLVKFRRRCGTHYVSVIVYGGELLMALQDSSQSTSSKEQFEADVRAAAAGTATGSAQYRSSVERLESQKDIRITSRKAGGQGNEAHSVASFTKEVQSFSKQVFADRTAHILYAIVSPYVGFKTTTAKSAAVDLAVEKLMLMDDKFVILKKVTEEPAMYDVDADDLPLVVRERDRLREATDTLRIATEACAYPTDPKNDDPPECDKIKLFAMPPTRAMGDGVPDRFAADCRQTEVSVPRIELKTGKRLKGDGKIGNWMLIQFEVKPTVVDRRFVRVRVIETASEPGTSKKASEEDIVEFYGEADIHPAPGCIVVEAPPPFSVDGVRFTHNMTKSYDSVLDKATCISTAHLLGGGGFQAKRYDAFQCNVSFLPLRGVVFEHGELLSADRNIRPRHRFKELGWLAVAGPSAATQQ
ncbi:hypothetical protein [Ensifer sp. ENS12]|uniref:hypothetical protein n=1 Tax=Ensifer sp. ENS12 TaxID=2854774 RepID=UPI001C48FEB2|nr:hypothetical protein [Ensifer sp. ENS12]MBV7522335.1 hypothetical protein [Ensifer sp. ENS12]